jgi:hypothetical protein
MTDGEEATPATSGVSALITSLREQASQTERLVAERRDSVAEEEERRRGRDRSQIARMIVQLFAVSFVIVLIVLPLLAYFGEGQVWDKVSDKLVTLVSSVLLPVVTLVIGYYFGTEQSRQGGNNP